MKPKLTLEQIHKQNVSRLKRWHVDVKGWTCADTSNAMCGEAGEAANVVKKIRRIETGVTADPDGKRRERLVHELAWELADTLLYIDLLAADLDIDLSAAVKEKFNLVSREMKFPERL